MVLSPYKPIRQVAIEGKPLPDCDLQCQNMRENIDSDDLCEYVATVKWVKTVDRAEAKWEPKSGLYTTQLIRASLDGQPATISFLETAFGVSIRKLLK